MTQRERRLAAVLVPVTALAAGLLFATSASTAQGTDLRGERVELTDLIAREQQEVAEQELMAAALRDRVAAATGLAAVGDASVAAERAAGDALSGAAGLTPLSGQAVSVSLDDAPPGAVSEDPDDLVVHQQDVQAVVNALWAGGARGMTLMGQRVVSTSAVLCVGNTVLLHGRVYGPPFVVTAVGEPDRLRAALDAEPGVLFFQRFVEDFGLGYDVSEPGAVTLPAYDGPLELPAVAPS